MNRTKQVISVGIALFSITTTALKSDQVIAAPACRDVPSCGVAGIIIGTQIIGGVLYYIVENAAGVVHKVRAKNSPLPAHRSHQGGEHPPRSVIEMPGAVISEEQCREFARIQQEKYGGIWEPIITHIAGSSPDSEGIPSRPLYKCSAKKVG